MNGLHLALGVVFLGHDLVVLFHHLGRFVDRKDLGNVGGKSLSTVSFLSNKQHLFIVSQLT